MARAPRRQSGSAKSEPERGVRRASPGRGLRKLPSDLEELAAGRRDRLRSPQRPRGRIEDTRVAGLIAGVANHDARRVYDARLARLRSARAEGPAAELGWQLCDAVLLGLWRARNVTGFDALVHDVAGIELRKARALVEQSAQERGFVVERLPDIAVALWIRSEAALLACCAEASVEVFVKQQRLRFALSLPLTPPALAADAIAAIGRGVAGLAHVF